MSFRNGLLLAVAGSVLFAVGSTRYWSGAQARANRDDPLVRIPVQSGWKASPRNPFCTLGEHRAFATWNDPCLLKMDGAYVMYLTTALSVPGKPPVQPFRAVSRDGVDWRLEPATPLLAPGPDPSDFDFENVETPSVVVFKGTYHLYYTGVRKGLAGPMAIGHATSADGVEWTKDPRNPVLRPTGVAGEAGGLQVAEPAAVVRNDNLYLYFSAVGLRAGGEPPIRRVISLATSADGSRFGAPRVVLEQNELFPASLGFDGYSAPSAIVHEGRVHLYYDVGYWDSSAERKWTQVALHHAVSDDGETNWTQDAGAILTRRSFPWTSLEIRSPSVLIEGDQVRLWFAGNARVDEFLPDVKKTGRTRLFGIGLITKD
jgi:predicted GH43/DUF377 family glycosyl hydrolase